ncbi:MAG: type II toxin-antitoxin system VapC family toxin [Solirubrobacterales bacterium]
MKLLLDTHVVLWWTHDSRRLSETARELVGDPRHDVLLSAVVAWEIAIKRALGKLRMRPALVTELLADGGAAELAVSVAHATEEPNASRCTTTIRSTGCSWRRRALKARCWSPPTKRCASTTCPSLGDRPPAL